MTSLRVDSLVEQIEGLKEFILRIPFVSEKETDEGLKDQFLDQQQLGIKKVPTVTQLQFIPNNRILIIFIEFLRIL